MAVEDRYLEKFCASVSVEPEESSLDIPCRPVPSYVEAEYRCRSCGCGSITGHTVLSDVTPDNESEIVRTSPDLFDSVECPELRRVGSMMLQGDVVFIEFKEGDE